MNLLEWSYEYEYTNDTSGNNHSRRFIFRMNNFSLDSSRAKGVWEDMYYRVFRM